MSCPHSTGCEPKTGECHGACVAAQQTPQQFVKAALAAEREQWTGPSAQQTPRPSWLDGGAEAVAMAAEDGLLPAEPHTTLLDPQDRPPMAACVVAVVWLIASAVAEYLPRVCA